ncbi:restriction endonuclease subunit S [Senegalimassilia anaerobia]|uniref:restriction endonuclease subunit S n=1 Tax=Senegalimassilia anaerobia TaxID=1473216 RepID=UPI00248F3547|nr:restriction endonuclease subunit S [Senegalimassilia anaerobia]
MTNKPQFVGEKVKLGSLIKPAKVERCGKQGYPILSITKDDGIVLQSTKFKKRIASKDTASYKVVPRGKLIQGIHIDEANFAIQNLVDWGIVSPAYKVWDIDTAIVDPEYLALALRSESSLAYYRRNLVGTVHRRGRMSNEVFYRLEVNLPSLQVQKRILAILGDAASQIAYAQQQIAQLDSLVKSRFVEMFGDCTVRVSLGEVCFFKSGKTLPKEKEMPSGDYLYAKVGDLNLPGNERTIRFSRSYVDAATAKRCLIPKGAVVFPKRGGAIGTNKKRITGEDCCLDLNLMSVIPGEKIRTEYLLAWFEQMDLADIANGSTVPQINNKDLNPLTIALPKMELQQEFADFVAQVDKSRFIAQQQIEKLQMLYDSLAQEYFGD